MRVLSLLRRGAAAALSVLLFANPAHVEWREASSDHFVIYADSSEVWLKGFAERLERFDAAVRVARKLPSHAHEKSNRLTIYVVRGGAEAQALCGKGCGSIAGFYIPRAGGSVAYSIREQGASAGELTADTVLFHEYAHHFMFSTTGLAYPKWFSEGFAEYFSTATIERDGSVGFGKPPLHRAYELVNIRPIPIEQLFDPPARPTGEFQSLFYGRAWLLTYMLSMSPTRASQLTRYIALLNQGRPNLEAAREAFGDLKLLDRELTRFIRRPLSYIRFTADRLKLGPVALRLLTPGEVATMPIRMKSDRGVNRAQALALLPAARRAAAAHSADAGAQVVLAEAEYDAGNDAEAEAAADRALAANARHRGALLYKGRALVRRATIAKTRDATTWKAARSWFVKANKVEPDAAEPLMLFYTSFMAADEQPTKNAIDGLLWALELSPQSGELRMLAARELVFAGRMKEARAALLPIAFDPHRRSGANIATELVAKIDAGATAADMRGLIGGLAVEEDVGNEPK